MLHLNLIDTEMDQEHGGVLARAIRGGHLPALEGLALAWNELLRNNGVKPIMRAQRDEGCCRLEELVVTAIDGHGAARVHAFGLGSGFKQAQLPLVPCST